MGDREAPCGRTSTKHAASMADGTVRWFMLRVGNAEESDNGIPQKSCSTMMTHDQGQPCLCVAVVAEAEEHQLMAGGLFCSCLALLLLV